MEGGLSGCNTVVASIKMNASLPESPRQLHWQLAWRLGLAAIVIGCLAGGILYWSEERRVEQSALERAMAGARHFQTPAMQMALNARSAAGHEELRRLLDSSNFVGIRVFGSDKRLIYETWAEIPAALIDAAKTREHEWPPLGESNQIWTEVSGERLVQVILPLIGNERVLVGFVEGVSRLDKATLALQREQIGNASLSAVMAVLATTVLMYPLLLRLLQSSVALSRRLMDSNLSLMRLLGNAIAKRDSDTDAHNYRVTFYAVAVAEAIGISGAEITDLIVGAFLHDVGKIGIPDRIVHKPGKLTDDEFAVMKSHVLLGIEIVADNLWLVGAAQVIRHHHERFDGTGYPDGLSGGAIPRSARIFAVADVFDALISKRPYKEPMTLDQAMIIIERDSGRHFDPEIVAAFRQIAPSLYARVAHASDAELRQAMQGVLTRYFGT